MKKSFVLILFLLLTLSLSSFSSETSKEDEKTSQPVQTQASEEESKRTPRLEKEKVEGTEQAEQKEKSPKKEDVVQQKSVKKEDVVQKESPKKEDVVQQEGVLKEENKNKTPQPVQKQASKEEPKRTPLLENQNVEEIKDLNLIKKLEVNEEEKKAFQRKLALFKNKTEVFLLPIIHSQKGDLQKLISSVYKSFEKDIQETHPDIVATNEAYLMKKTPYFSSSLSSEDLDSFQDKENESENERTYASFFLPAEKFNDEMNSKKDSPAMDEEKTLEDSTSPLFFHFFTKNFFDANKEEYELKKFVNFINSKALAQHFDFLENIHAFIEVKILEWELHSEDKKISHARDLNLKAFCRLRVRLVSSESGLIIWEDVKERETEGSSDRSIEPSTEKTLLNHLDLAKRSLWEAFGQLLPSLLKGVKKLIWEGRVALVSGEKIYINGGQESGIQIGDVLKIVKKEKVIYDPKTRELIGIAEEGTKGLVKVIRHFGTNGSVGKIQFGSDFQINDRVKLF